MLRPYFHHDIQNYQQFVLQRSEEHTSELQSHVNLVCRLLLEKKNWRLRGFGLVSPPPPAISRTSPRMPNTATATATQIHTGMLCSDDDGRNGSSVVSNTSCIP